MCVVRVRVMIFHLYIFTMIGNLMELAVLLVEKILKIKRKFILYYNNIKTLHGIVVAILVLWQLLQQQTTIGMQSPIMYNILFVKLSHKKINISNRPKP